LNKVTQSILLIFVYFFLPFQIVKIFPQHSFISIFIFYVISFIAILYLLRDNSDTRYRLAHKIEDLHEKLNIINDEKSRELKNKSALVERIRRYDNLKKIIEELNQHIDLDFVAEELVSIAFSAISGNKGVCILYLVDKQTQFKLRIFKAKKENDNLIIKAKEGDIFDFWVLRHTSSLLIEDIKKDFRFDPEKLKDYDERPISSLISVPLVSENRFLGILRLDSPDIGFYSQEDLRLLMTICDLGAVALENGELFKKTQDLAIHDELTLLYTKGYFIERLQEECKRSISRSQGLALFMLDIDYFKTYNDKFGHTAGDIVLRTLSRKIEGYLQDFNPIISRFGGEEFCIILPDMDKARAYQVAMSLRDKLEKTKIMLRRNETNITVSIGVAHFPSDAVQAQELISKSDRAMYEAKKRGRNQACLA